MIGSLEGIAPRFNQAEYVCLERAKTNDAMHSPAF